MATFLFDEIVFGPVNSRRLGISLGINLLPTNKKICSFNCIYCECGLNDELGERVGKMPQRENVKDALRIKLNKMVEDGILPDVITFAGNGEPTLHPNFSDIIDDTIELRNKLCPNARIAVLSNGSRIDKPSVFNALLKIDDNIQKLDAGTLDKINLIDQPNYPYKLENTIDLLKKFDGKVIIQTMFLGGEHNGNSVNNTSEEEVSEWIKHLDQIKPKSVMIYTIARDTPILTLKKLSIDELENIAEKARSKGYLVSVSG